MTRTERCPNCAEVLTPRGDLPARFCPRCGQRVPPAAVHAAPANPDEAEPSALAYSALFLALFGLFMFRFPLFGLVPIVTGLTALGRIAASNGRLTGRGYAKAALWIGALECLVFTGVWILRFFF